MPSFGGRSGACGNLHSNNNILYSSSTLPLPILDRTRVSLGVWYGSWSKQAEWTMAGEGLGGGGGGALGVTG